MQTRLSDLIIMLLLIGQLGCIQIRPLITEIPSTKSNSSISTRWTTYQLALSRAIIKRDDGLCEWEIWGVSNNQVYVWAECQGKNDPAAGSGPAVIYLGDSYEIQRVIIPRDGVNFNNDVKSLFPSYIQTKIFSRAFDAPKYMEHIQGRKISNGPPLIALSATQLP